MSTHTPGPWIAKLLIYTGEYAVLYENGHGMSRLDDKHGGFLVADARLIAAAPDLIGSGQSMCDALGAAEWSTPEHAEEILMSLIQNQWPQLHAAIAKAKGE